MMENSVINREVFTDLMSSVEKRENKLKIPSLDLPDETQTIYIEEKIN